VNTNGTVTVRNGRYHPRGEFHRVEPNTPIRNADTGWELMGVTNPRQMVYIHSYGGEAPFFEALARGRLLATRCDNPGCDLAGTIYQPFRIHCSECLGRNTPFDMTELARQTARVHTFMVCERSGAFNVLNTPIKFINLEFDGVATILMSYLSVGEPAIGLRVVPIFRTVDPTYTIVDLSWVPEGTRAEELPQGFTFQVE
jgi:uncharacterized OB-fold protein